MGDCFKKMVGKLIICEMDSFLFSAEFIAFQLPQSIIIIVSDFCHYLGASVCLVVYIHGKNSKEKSVRFGSMLCSSSYSSFFRQMKVKTSGILIDKWEKKI